MREMKRIEPLHKEPEYEIEESEETSPRKVSVTLSMPKSANKLRVMKSAIRDIAKEYSLYDEAITPFSERYANKEGKRFITFEVTGKGAE